MGHYVVDIPTSSLTEGSTPLVELKALSVSPNYTSLDRIPVPPQAVEIFRDGINARNATPEINDRIREALVMICAEAHKADAMPEHLLITLKELCHSLPEYERIGGAQREAFLSTLVTTAIEEYYRA